MESSSSFLPSNDLLFEIFSSCCLKLVDKLKIVSKVCNEIMYENTFLQSHKKKTGTVYGYIIQSFKNNYHFFDFISPDDLDNKSLNRSTVALDFLPPKSEILACSDQGILCCITTDKDHRNPRFFLCKPTTRQIQMLPNPKLRYTTNSKVAMVVLQSSPLHYKIVRLSRLETMLWSEHCAYLCERFDSKTMAWRQCPKILLPIRVFICENPVVIASGRFHWLLSDNRSVLAFDLEKETDTSHTIFTLPSDVIEKEDKFPSTKELIKYKSKLGLICKEFPSGFEIWVLEDYRNHVWKKIKNINAEGVKKKEPYSVPVGLYGSNIALMKGYDYIFYNLQDSSVNVAQLGHGVTHVDTVFPFRSDLEHVDLSGRS